MPYSPMQLAEAFIKAGELPDALDALNAHLAENPDDPDAQRLRVQVWMRTDDPAHRIAARDALQAMPRTPDDDYTLSVILEQTEPTLTPALETVKRATSTATDDRLKSRALERQLNLMRKLGQLEAALQLALQRDWVQWAADAAADLNDDTRALMYYAQALERVDGLYEITSQEIAANIKARVLIKRGATLFRMGRYDEADKDYHAAAQVIPDDRMIDFTRALIQWHTGDKDAATQAIRAAYDGAPSGLQAMMRDDLTEDTAYAPLLAAIDAKN